MRASLPRGQSREINSYITDLLKNLISHEGLYLGLGPSWPEEDTRPFGLHTIPRADTQGVSR